MKNCLLTIGLIAFCHFLIAQSNVGVTVSIAHNSFSFEEMDIYDGPEDKIISFHIDRLSPSIRIGGLLKATFTHFYIQSEMVFERRSIDYSVVDYRTHKRDETYRMNELTHHLHVPIIIGKNFKGLNVFVGLKPAVHLNGKSDLAKMEGVSIRYREAALGAIAGLGMRIRNMEFDFRYELLNQHFGDQIRVHGDEYAFSQKINLISLNVAYLFKSKKID